MIAEPSKVGIVPSGKEQPNPSMAARLNSGRKPVRSTGMPQRSGTPTRYLAVGKLNDRRGYTTAIRAFALSGKLGDRLTIMGCGCYRRRLERWARALGVDTTVSFSEVVPGVIHDLGSFDAIILVSYEHESTYALVKSAVERDLMLILPNDIAELCPIASSSLIYLANPYDILSYSIAISHITRA